MLDVVTPTSSKADRLIQELSETIGLDQVDAHRAAFAALAVSKGWTKARIGRHLGISRERVGQKIDKLAHYAAVRKDVPTLRATMRKAAVTKPERERPPHHRLAAFKVADWEDLDLARQLIALVEDSAHH